MFLQELVNNLVRISGLFDHGSGGSCDPGRLQSLRQKHLSARRYTSETRLPLTEWRPSSAPEVQSSVHSDEPKPPDENGETSILARITVLMAGAIFGVILLYLCRRHYPLYYPTTNQTNRMAVSQYGFSIPSPLLLASKTGQGWVSSLIVARNCVILAMYIRHTSVVDSVSGKSNGSVRPNPTQTSLALSANPTTERVQDCVFAAKSSYESDCTMIDFPK